MLVAAAPANILVIATMMTETVVVVVTETILVVMIETIMLVAAAPANITSADTDRRVVKKKMITLVVLAGRCLY